MAIKTQPYTDYRPVNLNFTKKIPSDWIVKRAKFFFKEISERSIKGEEQLLSVSEHKGIVPRDSINVTMFQALSYEGYKLCNKGDIVINSLWAWHRGLGVSEYHGIVSTAYGVYRPLKPAQWNHRYLNYLLRDKAYVGECLIRSKGIWESRYQLTGSNFLDIPIIKPPLEVQNSIVEYLDKKNSEIEKFIRNKERLIEILEDQKKSEITRIIVEGVEGNEALKELDQTDIPYMPFKNKSSEIKRLKYLASLKGRIGFHGLKTSDFTNEGPFLITGTDFIEGRINWDTSVHITMKRYKENPYIQLKEGDFLITKDGTIGKTAIVDNLPYEASLNSGVMLVRSLRGEFLNKYLFWIINSRIFDEFVEITKTGSTVMHLYQHSFGNFKIPIPDLNTQGLIVQEIELVISKLNSAISKAQKEIAAIKEYREALITDLVTGKKQVPSTYSVGVAEENILCAAEEGATYNADNDKQQA